MHGKMTNYQSAGEQKPMKHHKQKPKNTCLLERRYGAYRPRHAEESACADEHPQPHSYVQHVSAPAVRDVIAVPDVPEGGATRGAEGKNGRAGGGGAVDLHS